MIAKHFWLDNGLGLHKGRMSSQIKSGTDTRYERSQYRLPISDYATVAMILYAAVVAWIPNGVIVSQVGLPSNI